MNNLERSRADGGELRIQNSKLRIYAVADSIFDLIGGTPLLRLGELEGGCDGCAFASGLAAIDAITDLLDPGDHIVAGNDLYGGTHRLFNTITSRHGIGTTTADADDPEDFRRAMTARTRLVFVETPTNPMMRIVDLERIRAIASEHDALLVVDNTFLTPIYQRPLDIGADLVVHSTTKYLNGHSDGIGGVVVARDPELAERLHAIQNNAGAIMGPFDAYLVLRGLKTLAIRMAAHEHNGRALSRVLASRKEVLAIKYPGLPDHAQYELVMRQQTGFGGMISFELGSVVRARAFCDALRVFILAESLGEVESLVCHPATMTHASVSAEARAQLGITDGLIRLSVGIEDADDLIEDVEGALDATR